MNESAKPSFGFFEDIKPDRAVPGPEVVARSIDAVGERLGFASREKLVKRRRRPPSEEPTDQLNVRATIADINRFVEWCERNRYSYREGFAILVAKIEG